MEITVTGQYLNITKKNLYASDSQEYLKAKFIFDDDWEGLTKTAVFYQNAESVYHVILDSEGSCIVPYEALTESGLLYIGVFGVSGTKRITTNIEVVDIAQGSYGNGLTPDDPSEDIYAQIVAIMEEQAVSAQATLTAQGVVEGYRNETLGFKETTDGYKNTTKEYMDTTEGYKDTTFGYKGEAEESATKAEEEANRALNNILNGVSTHNQDVTAHSSLIEDLRTVEAIARGRATAHVFDTYQDMLDWLDIPDNVEKLVVGDNLYIRDTGVKDYWWDGDTYQELEAESPDLTNYYTKMQVDSKMPILITRADYDVLVANGTVQADRTYDIIEEV